MARSNKARYGTQCKTWKGTVWASRSQKRAWSKTKKRESGEARSQARDDLRDDLRQA